MVVQAEVQRLFERINLQSHSVPVFLYYISSGKQLLSAVLCEPAFECKPYFTPCKLNFAL